MAANNVVQTKLQPRSIWSALEKYVKFQYWFMAQIKCKSQNNVTLYWMRSEGMKWWGGGLKKAFSIPTIASFPWIKVLFTPCHLEKEIMTNINVQVKSVTFLFIYFILYIARQSYNFEVVFVFNRNNSEIKYRLRWIHIWCILYMPMPFELLII